MFSKSFKALVGFSAVLLMVFLLSAASVQAAFPEKNITIIVPWGAGGGTDAVARVLANEAEEFTDVSINVENKTGGGGAVGHGQGARANPDGYTVTLTTVELVIQPHIEDVDYSYTDFRPIMQINLDPAAVTVQEDAEWDNIDELIEEAKESPGELLASGTATGGIWHLGKLALEAETGAEITWIPSEGMAPAVTDLMGGHVDLVTGSPGEVASQVEAGDLKMLAVMSEERVDGFPDVPTLKEEGIDVAIGTWRGLQVPADTPDEVVETLHEIFYQAFESEGFQNKMKDLGLGIIYRDPEEYAEFLENDYETFGELVEQFDL
ncbi:MAG: Bug family tripartite tricarboxylate transporter substrate binding protein [Halanaerobium sp.]